jgi:hypothetical protein
VVSRRGLAGWHVVIVLVVLVLVVFVCVDAVAADAAVSGSGGDFVVALLLFVFFRTCARRFIGNAAAAAAVLE